MHIMQADTVLFLASISRLMESNRMHGKWYPRSLIYIRGRYDAFPIFEMARMDHRFEEIKGVLGVENRKEFSDLVKHIEGKFPLSFRGRPVRIKRLVEVK